MNKEELEVLTRLTDGLFTLSEELRDFSMQICNGLIVGQKQESKHEQIVLSPVEVETKEAKTEAEPAQEEEQISYEELRAIMAKLPAAGKKDEAKAIIAALGASRLSEIAPSNYRLAYDKAKELLSE